MKQNRCVFCGSKYVIVYPVKSEDIDNRGEKIGQIDSCPECKRVHAELYWKEAQSKKEILNQAG